MTTPHRTTARFRSAVAACVIAGTAVAGAATAAPASARDGDVIRRGLCTRSSDWKLKLAPRDGRVRIEFEVDTNVVGQRWNVSISDNGIGVVNTTATTIDPSGDFVVRARTRDQAGTDNVTAKATNPATGESCTGTASI